MPILLSLSLRFSSTKFIVVVVTTAHCSPFWKLRKMVGDNWHQSRGIQAESIIVPMIIYFRMRLSLLDHVFDLSLLDLSSTNRTSFILRYLEQDIAPKLVFFRLSLHEPISIEADQVEAMVACVDSD